MKQNPILRDQKRGTLVYVQLVPSKFRNNEKAILRKMLFVYHNLLFIDNVIHRSY